MKRPSFQFYPYDLRNNANLRRCSWAARGVWLELMCLFHDSDEYGVLRWSLDEIALAVGCQIELVRELVEKGVLKGSEKVGDKVSFSSSFSQRNAPSISVQIINEQPAPLWYSSRMVRDEYVRNKKGEHGAKSQENPNVPRKKTAKNEHASAPEKPEEKDIDKDTFSPSPTSSSSSTSSKEEKNTRTPKADAFGVLQILQTFPTLDESVVRDFIAHRKNKRAPLTQSAWDAIAREIMASGWTPDRALRETMARGWQGFKADWVAEKPKRLNGQHHEELTWCPPELRGTPDDPLFNKDYIDATR